MTELTEQEKLARDEHIKQMVKEENDRAFKVVCTGIAIASFIIVIFSLF
jgi:hypothetical protein